MNKLELSQQIDRLFSNHSFLRIVALVTVLSAGTAISLGYLSNETYDRASRFNRMRPTSSGEQPSLFFLLEATSPDQTTCVMYANAAPLDYHDVLLPDPNLMTIACSPNDTNFRVVKTFPGVDPETNEKIFQDVVSSIAKPLEK